MVETDNKIQCTIAMLSKNIEKQPGASSFIQNYIGRENPVELGEEVSKGVMIGLDKPVKTNLINGFFDMETSFNGVRDSASAYKEINSFVIVIDMNKDQQETDYYLRNWIPEIRENYPDAQISFMLANNHKTNYEKRVDEEMVAAMVTRITHSKKNTYFNEDDLKEQLREMVRHKMEVDKENNKKLLETIKTCLSHVKPSHTIKKMMRVCNHAWWSVEDKLNKIRDLAKKPHKPMLGSMDHDHAQLYSILRSDESAVEVNDDLKKMMQANIKTRKINTSKSTIK